MPCRTRVQSTRDEPLRFPPQEENEESLALRVFLSGRDTPNTTVFGTCLEERWSAVGAGESDWARRRCAEQMSKEMICSVIGRRERVQVTFHSGKGFPNAPPHNARERDVDRQCAGCAPAAEALLAPRCAWTRLGANMPDAVGECVVHDRRG